MHASVTSFEEINLVIHHDNVEVQSYADAYSVRRSVIGYSHMVISRAFMNWWKRKLAIPRL